MTYRQFPKYVSVAEKRSKAERKRKQLLKKNPGLRPVEIDGSAIATTWWGKSWNKNLERYADYENRIGRGRNYVRHGAVLDLQIAPGEVTALVQGSRSTPYVITIKIKEISSTNWRNIQKACEGKFDSLKALLSGKFPKDLETLFNEKGKGLFPTPTEIRFSCSCPDWASMCKHVAATLYGVGARLDEDPLLFFTLRGVAVDDLVAQTITESTRDLLRKAGKKTGRVLEDTDLSDMFGIDLDSAEYPIPPVKPVKTDFKKAAGKTKEKTPLTGKKKTEKISAEKVPGKAVRIKEKPEKTRKGAAKPAPLPDSDRVEKLIVNSKKGISTAEIVSKTGIDTAKVRYLVSRLKHQGRITSAEWGRYTGIVPAKKKAAVGKKRG